MERQHICNLHQIRLSASKNHCIKFKFLIGFIEHLEVAILFFFPFLFRSNKFCRNLSPFSTWYLKKNVNSNVRMWAPSTSASVKIIILWYRRASFLKSSPWNEQNYVHDAWLSSSPFPSFFLLNTSSSSNQGKEKKILFFSRFWFVEERKR